MTSLSDSLSTNQSIQQKRKPFRLLTNLPPLSTGLNAILLNNEILTLPATCTPKMTKYTRAPVIEFAQFTSDYNQNYSYGESFTEKGLLAPPFLCSTELNLPNLRFFSTSLFNGNLVIFGGEIDGKCQNSTYLIKNKKVYEVFSKQKPAARKSATLNQVGNQLVLVGGESSNNLQRFTLGDVWGFDGCEWKQLEVGIPPRSCHAACVTKGGLVVSGGIRYNQSYQTVLSDIFLLKTCEFRVQEKVTRKPVGKHRRLAVKSVFPVDLMFSPDFITNHINQVEKYGLYGEIYENVQTITSAVEMERIIIIELNVKFSKLYSHSMIVFPDGKGVVLGGFNEKFDFNQKIYSFDANQLITCQ